MTNLPVRGFRALKTLSLNAERTISDWMLSRSLRRLLSCSLPQIRRLVLTRESLRPTNVSIAYGYEHSPVRIDLCRTAAIEGLNTFAKAGNA